MDEQYCCFDCVVVVIDCCCVFEMVAMVFDFEYLVEIVVVVSE